MELVNRKDMYDLEELRVKYEWLVSLPEDILVCNLGDVQSALSDFLSLIYQLQELPVLATEVPDYPGDPNIENTEAWYDMN